MHSGPKVSLQQLLDCKEQRAFRQRELISIHSLPLVSFSINMVGAIKKNALSSRAFYAGYQTIVDDCLAKNLPIVDIEKTIAVTGYEALFSVNTKSYAQLKLAMVNIEDTHPFGRLFDIDVIDIDGLPISRDTFDLPRRRCFVCEQEAKLCARNRSHSLDELLNKMTEIIHESQ